MEFNKKGMEISLNFVIIAVLALVALIVIALFFTGGMSKIFTKQASVVKITDQEYSLLEAGCDTYCSLCQKAIYDDPPFEANVKAQFGSCDALIKARRNIASYYATVCEKNCARASSVEQAKAAPPAQPAVTP